MEQCIHCLKRSSHPSLLHAHSLTQATILVSQNPFYILLHKHIHPSIKRNQASTCSAPCSPSHGVLAHSGWHIKIPQAGWLINSRYLLLTVLEAGSLKSGSQHGWVRALFQVVDFLFHPQMAERLGSSVGLFRRTLTSFIRALPSWPDDLPNGSLLNTSILVIGISTHEFGGGHKHSAHSTWSSEPGFLSPFYRHGHWSWG